MTSNNVLSLKMKIYIFQNQDNAFIISYVTGLMLINQNSTKIIFSIKLIVIVRKKKFTGIT